MKKTLSIAVLLCCIICQLHSQGYIVPNGITYHGFDGLGYEIQVLQNPTNSNYTGFALVPNGRTPPSSTYVNTFAFSQFLDEGVRVFLVSANQHISQQAIQSGSYTELLSPNSYVFGSGSPFYLGLYTGETFPQNGIYSDPLFGWARLVNNQGVIEMLDSALVYKAQGILAGTQTIIPEPSTFSLTALGALLLGLRRARNQPARP
jgi:hypothetical protein